VNILNNIKLILPEENIDINPQIKNFAVQDLYDLVNSIVDAIDNFDLDLINETLNQLLNYNLSSCQISTIGKVQALINVYDYDNAYELITNFKCSL
jgi:hypothetical protein